jgi:thiaminase/transcriptional activator TenA
MSDLIPQNSVAARLISSCAADWQAYTAHPFVTGLASGTLPEAAFRYYLKQDYLFLIHFARAHALAVYKADTVADMRSAAAAVHALIDHEMRMHVEYCAGWELTEAEMASVPEDPACVAYTRYVLDRGMAGDILDLLVALAPCTIGYGVIGSTLAADPATLRAGNPYDPWISMYSGAEYLDGVREATAQLDRVFEARGGEARIEDIVATFRAATRLESDFWQMGLNAA